MLLQKLPKGRRAQHAIFPLSPLPISIVGPGGKSGMHHPKSARPQPTQMAVISLPNLVFPAMKEFTTQHLCRCRQLVKAQPMAKVTADKRQGPELQRLPGSRPSGKMAAGAVATVAAGMSLQPIQHHGTQSRQLMNMLMAIQKVGLTAQLLRQLIPLALQFARSPSAVEPTAQTVPEYPRKGLIQAEVQTDVQESILFQGTNLKRPTGSPDHARNRREPALSRQLQHAPVDPLAQAKIVGAQNEAPR